MGLYWLRKHNFQAWACLQWKLYPNIFCTLLLYNKTRDIIFFVCSLQSLHAFKYMQIIIIPIEHTVNQYIELSTLKYSVLSSLFWLTVGFNGGNQNLRTLNEYREQMKNIIYLVFLYYIPYQTWWGTIFTKDNYSVSWSTRSNSRSKCKIKGHVTSKYIRNDCRFELLTVCKIANFSFPLTPILTDLAQGLQRCIGGCVKIVRAERAMRLKLVSLPYQAGLSDMYMRTPDMLLYMQVWLWEWD